MAEYIDKSELYKEIAELEELSRKRVVDTPTIWRKVRGHV